MVPDTDLLLAAVGDDDDDEEMASISSDDDSRSKGRDKNAPKVRNLDDSEEDGACLYTLVILFYFLLNLSISDDFEASDSDSGSPTDSDSEASGAQTASDASGDRVVATKSKKSREMLGRTLMVKGNVKG